MFLHFEHRHKHGSQANPLRAQAQRILESAFLTRQQATILAPRVPSQAACLTCTHNLQLQGGETKKAPPRLEEAENTRKTFLCLSTHHVAVSRGHFPGCESAQPLTQLPWAEPRGVCIPSPSYSLAQDSPLQGRVGGGTF